MLFGRTTTISSGFTPSGSPAGWWPADQITGLEDADPVGTWPDQSGNSNDFTQATAAQKPTYKINIQNSLPVVRFDGTADNMASADIDFTGGLFTFQLMTARRTPNSSWPPILQEGSWGVLFGYHGAAPFTLECWINSGNAINSDTALTENTFYVADLVSDGSNRLFYLNGAADGTGAYVAPSAHSALCLSDPSYPTAFDLGEAIVYTTNLSLTDSGSNDSGLNTKWAVY